MAKDQRPNAGATSMGDRWQGARQLYAAAFPKARLFDGRKVCRCLKFSRKHAALKFAVCRWKSYSKPQEVVLFKRLEIAIFKQCRLEHFARSPFFTVCSKVFMRYSIEPKVNTASCSSHTRSPISRQQNRASAIQSLKISFVWRAHNISHMHFFQLEDFARRQGQFLKKSMASSSRKMLRLYARLYVNNKK